MFYLPGCVISHMETSGTLLLFIAGSGVSVQVRQHPRHAGARPPDRVGGRHLRKERLPEGEKVVPLLSAVLCWTDPSFSFSFKNTERLTEPEPSSAQKGFNNSVWVVIWDEFWGLSVSSTARAPLLLIIKVIEFSLYWLSYLVLNQFMGWACSFEHEDKEHEDK